MSRGGRGGAHKKISWNVDFGGGDAISGRGGSPVHTEVDVGLSSFDMQAEM